MNDIKLNYWKEAVISSLDELGLLHFVTTVHIAAMAKDMLHAEEQMGMAFGYDAIPNPAIAEIADIKRKYDAQIKELEKREYNYRKSVATRRNVPIEAVYMDRDGSVMIDPKLA